MSDTKLRLRRKLVEAAGPVAAFICDRADAQYPNLIEWIDHVTQQLDLDTLRDELLEMARPTLMKDDAVSASGPSTAGLSAPTSDFEHLLALGRARLERYTDAQTARKACDQARAQHLTDRRSLYRYLARYLARPEDRSLFVRLYGS